MSWDKKHLPLYLQLSALIIVVANENHRFRRKDLSGKTKGTHRFGFQNIFHICGVVILQLLSLLLSFRRTVRVDGRLTV